MANTRPHQLRWGDRDVKRFQRLQREAIIAANETEKYTDIRVILAYAYG